MHQTFCFQFVLLAILILGWRLPATQADDPVPTTTTASPLTELRDTVYLRSGGELTGKILSESKDERDGRMYVVIRTESGGLVRLDVARLVGKIQRADKIDAEYQRRLAAAVDDPNQLWKLYDWCKEQPSGGYRFKRELQFLLERITELDAHDDRARRLLGYDLVGGRWVFKPALYAAHGYLKKGNSWAPEMQSDVDQQLERQAEEIGERKKKFGQWKRGVKPGASRAELAQQLFAICDELTVPIIMDQEAKSEKDPVLRLMYIEAFGRIPSFEANKYLCYFAIEDPVAEIRERALTLLGQPHFDHEVSARLMSGYLSDSNVATLKRAAFAIGELGATGSLMALIDALETKHTVTQGGSVPGGVNTSFGSGGIGFNAGGAPTVKRDVVIKADEARAALKRITQQDFGFSESAWKSWYIKNYTLYNVRVGADE